MFAVMNARVLAAIAISLSLGVVSAGCEKTDHENIEKWMKTAKGPGKLRKAVADSSLDPDLVAHAAENLIRIGQDSELKSTFAAMDPSRAQAVMAKLAPRLWERARVEREDAVPLPINISAKDALFDIRPYSDEATRAQIDGYLTDWYAVSFYDKRATLGNHQGSEVLRTVGAPAAERLMSAANTIVSRPEVDGKRVRIGDELMLGLAAVGTPASVKYVLDIATMDRGDDTLTERAMSALFKAFIQPEGFDAVDKAALAPNLDKLVEIAVNDANTHQATNDAVELIRVVGMPGCLPPLIELVKDHRHAYRYRGSYNAILCAGAKAIPEVAHALPANGQYVAAELGGSTWVVIAKNVPREQALTALRGLVTDASWVARWIAIEGLAALKSKEDIERIRGLSGDNTRLEGYWGPQDDVPAKDRKKDPTLGARAKELATSLSG
jgi:hypothetical protein